MGQLFTDLADVLRETGYPVIEVGDWRNHHHGPLADHVGVIVWHHTAGPEPEDTSSNFPSLDVIRWGRAGLPGPLSNIGMGYNGTLYVISAGTCYHAGTGGWNGLTGNSTALGIEAEDAGDGDWTDAQLDCYPRIGAVLSQYLGEGAIANCGHKEWAPDRKIDPAGIDMGWARSRVQWYLDHPDQISKEEADMPLSDDDLRKVYEAVWHGAPGAPLISNRMDGKPDGWPEAYLGSYEDRIVRQNLRPMRAEILKAIQDASNGSTVEVDEQAIIDGVLSGLSPSDIASAVLNNLPPNLARQVVNEIGQGLTQHDQE